MRSVFFFFLDLLCLLEYTLEKAGVKLEKVLEIRFRKKNESHTLGHIGCSSPTFPSGFHIFKSQVN